MTATPAVAWGAKTDNRPSPLPWQNPATASLKSAIWRRRVSTAISVVSKKSARQELPCPPVGGGVPQLGHGPGLDLTNPLPGQAEVLAHLVEGAGLAPVEAKAQPEDLPLALVQGDQHLGHLTGEQRGGGGVERRNRGAVLHDVAQLGIAVFPQGLGERKRFGGMAQDLGDLLLFQLQVRGQLAHRGATTQLAL